VPVRATERFLPSPEEISAHEIGTFLLRECGKFAQDTFRRPEVVSKAAPDSQIAIEFFGQGAHFAPPATGHG
jgi:hypothetical protein